MPNISDTPYAALFRNMFPGDGATAQSAWERAEELTEELIFKALIESWGFKKLRRNMPEVNKRQYIREIDNDDGGTGAIVYTLSGGPIVIFTATGKFQEWV